MRTWVSSFAAALLMTVPLRAQPNDADQRASELFQRFEAAYAAGDVSGARAFMQQAFDLSRRSELLYNLAELDRELGDCRKASSEYADYLALTPAPGTAAKPKLISGHSALSAPRLQSLRKRCCRPSHRNRKRRAYWNGRIGARRASAAGRFSACRRSLACRPFTSR
jgi:hypothetical protein